MRVQISNSIGSFFSLFRSGRVSLYRFILELLASGGPIAYTSTVTEEKLLEFFELHYLEILLQDTNVKLESEAMYIEIGFYTLDEHFEKILEELSK